MLRNREKDAAYGKIYNATHKVEAAAYSKAWRETNREIHAARAKAWDVANAEKRKISRALRYAANRTELLAKNKKWREENRDKRVATQAKRRARVLGALGSFTSDEFAAIVAKQRGRCADCNLKHKLTVDHIVPVSKGGCNYAFNLQGLCHPCNSKKNNFFTTSLISLFDHHTQ